MSAKKFPKTLYLKFEEEGTEDEWLQASEDADTLAERNRIVRAGRYELVETMELQNRTVVVSARK